MNEKEFKQVIADFAESQLWYKNTIPSIIKDEIYNVRDFILRRSLNLIIKYQGNISIDEYEKYLIEHFPQYHWSKNLIKSTVSQGFSFRIKNDSIIEDYFQVGNTLIIKPGYVYELLSENIGKFLTLIHIKKTTGEYNLMNCQIILVGDKMVVLKEKGIRKNIYLASINEVRVGGFKYIVEW